MRLFGKRNKEKEKGEVLLGEPLKVRLPEDPVPQLAEDPALPADVVGGNGLEPVVQHGSGQSMEILLRENEALKREIADLKSRIAYARSVLLADVEVPEAYRVAPQMPQQDPTMMAMDAMASATGTAMGGVTPQAPAASMTAPQPAMGMDGMVGSPAMQTHVPPQPADDIRAMLAELKQDIASIQRGVTPPPTGMAAMGAAGLMGAAGVASAAAMQPADDIRAMLAELKQDIASIQRGVTPPAVSAPPQQPADDIRAMLAELKQDIASIRQEVPQPPATSAMQPPGEDLRAMLVELKQDIAAIRREEPVVQRRQDDDLREMLAKLKADIDSLKHEKGETRGPEEGQSPAQDNGVHRLLEELQQGMAELSFGNHGHAASAEARPEHAVQNSDPLMDLPEREGRAPLFGGGRTNVKEPDGRDGKQDPVATASNDAAAGGHAEDELSSRIESLLAELHNELRQASGREFIKDEPVEAKDRADSGPDLDDEEPRRAALH